MKSLKALIRVRSSDIIHLLINARIFWRDLPRQSGPRCQSVLFLSTYAVYTQSWPYLRVLSILQSITSCNLIKHVEAISTNVIRV